MPLQQAEYDRATITITSFDFGIPQTMLNGSSWPTHANRFHPVYEELAVGSDADFVFGCGLGDHRQGFRASDINIEQIVHTPLPKIRVLCSGAYATVYNIRDQSATPLSEETWQVEPMGRHVDIHWQA